MLQQVKVGDKVTFEAAEATSGYTVTTLDKAKLIYNSSLGLRR